jgi:hypothetical protein
MRIFRNKRFLWFLLLGPLCLVGSLATVTGETSQEYQLKAAFLVNFARFMTWPEQSFSPTQPEFTLCVAGMNPFGTALRAAESKMINGRNIKVIYADSLQNLPQCQMLYVSRSEENKLDHLSALEQQAVVTVSDIPGFVETGGSIEFVTREDRLSFIINHSSLKRRGIQASASMLDLAASVR